MQGNFHKKRLIGKNFWKIAWKELPALMTSLSVALAEAYKLSWRKQHVGTTRLFRYCCRSRCRRFRDHRVYPCEHADPSIREA